MAVGADLVARTRVMTKDDAIHVVHVTTVHPPFDQRIFHRECYSLARAGLKVTLLAQLQGDIVRDGIHVVSLGGAPRPRGGVALGERWRRGRAALKAALQRRGGLYHVHDPELIPTALALKRRTGARVIYDCHEDNIGFVLQKEHIPRSWRRSLSAIVALCERYAAGRVDAVVAADEGVRRRFSAWGARTEVLFNFPRLELFPPFQAARERAVDLVYHGTVPRYHMEMCLAIDDELVRRGIEARWLMFGRIADVEWARRRVEDRGATHRILLGGMVPHEQVAQVVAQARIGLIPLPDTPKFRHNIPTKLFEFMALGLPVVLSDLPPSRGFVGDGGCALMVPADSPGAYADSIQRLLGDSDLRDRMGREGRRRVEEMYNWTSEGAKLLELYRNLGQWE